MNLGLNPTERKRNIQKRTKIVTGVEAGVHQIQCLPVSLRPLLKLSTEAAVDTHNNKYDSIKQTF